MSHLRAENKCWQCIQNFFLFAESVIRWEGFLFQPLCRPLLTADTVPQGNVIVFLWPAALKRSACLEIDEWIQEDASFCVSLKKKKKNSIEVRSSQRLARRQKQARLLSIISPWPQSTWLMRQIKSLIKIIKIFPALITLLNILEGAHMPWDVKRTHTYTQKGERGWC